ncbi:hypothetical protein ArV2_gp30 [Arthrobacter phage vB_ArS-ArV2]|uniref:Uncharacterized protein n=1 Tax=Arthrobacter phage vB_ArS-ArV2 TaxID=1414742 RepID=V5R8R8_9CAUD|nr:hypothetical protein ArV2_gp30 [Arthrobacter phage vB_ArS-ArV2]AHB31641.1 hypothetical protein ArV2_gp30 [Arthrobacter phage vB_ArS-ArV2]
MPVGENSHFVGAKRHGQGTDMETTEIRTGQAEQAGESSPPWTQVEELNWKADRVVLRDLKKRGEEPSIWLTTEYRELNTRREEARRG